MSQLGIGGPAFDDRTYSDEDVAKFFTVWDKGMMQEKMMKMKMMMPADKQETPCAFRPGPTRWARKGTEIILKDEAM